MRHVWLCLVVAMMVGCDRSTPAPAGGGAAGAGGDTPAERLKDDLRRVGQDLNALGNQAATQVRPALERAGEEARAGAEEARVRLERAAQEARPALERAREEARQAAHETAVRVARETATQPATQPH